jgi:hypothetical protein
MQTANVSPACIRQVAGDIGDVGSEISTTRGRIGSSNSSERVGSVTARKLWKAMEDHRSLLCKRILRAPRAHSVSSARVDVKRRRSGHTSILERSPGRMPICSMLAIDPVTRMRSWKDVAYLQDLTDPLLAIRELLLLRLGDPQSVSLKLCKDGGSQFRVADLIDELDLLKVDWERITHTTRDALISFLAGKSNGLCPIAKILGAEDPTPETPWSELPLSDQWSKYTSELDLSRAVLLSSRRSSRFTTRPVQNPPINWTVSPKLLDEVLAADEVDKIVFLGRDDMTSLSETTRAIQSHMQELSSATSAVVDMRNDIYFINDEGDEKDDVQKRREKLAQEWQERKIQTSKSLFLSARQLGVPVSIIPSRKAISHTSFAHFFSLKDTMTDETDIGCRRLMRSVGIPAGKGIRLRREFLRIADKSESIHRFDQFAHVVSKISSLRLNDILESAKFQKEWRTLSNDSRMSVTLDSFIIWCTRAIS